MKSNILGKKRFVLVCFLGLIMVVSQVGAGLETAVSATTTTQWQCFKDGTSDPCQREINEVDMLSSTVAWAVGDKRLAMRWNGSAWTEMPLPESVLGDLYGVDVYAENDVWVVGYYYDSLHGNHKDIVLHWTGAAWEEVDLKTPSLIGPRSVDIIAPDDIWIAAINGIFHWDGTDWTEIGDFNVVSAMDMVSADDGWIFGKSGDVTTFYKWDGSSFSSVTVNWPYNVPRLIEDLQFLSTNNVWAAGEDGLIWHWNGVEWLYDDQNLYTDFVGISMVSANEGWVISSNMRLYWDGVDWEVISGTGGNSISVVDANNGIIGTSYGRVFNIGQSTDRSAVSATNVLGGAPLGAVYYDIAFADTQNGWAVGQTSSLFRTLVHWDGQQWSLNLPFEMGHALTGIDLLSATDVWVVGHGSSLFHWDGVNWSKNDPPNLEGALEAVSIVSADDVWAAGYSHEDYSMGIIWHWDGTSWTEVTIPVEIAHLNDIFMLSATDGWAVGLEGTILHWNGTDWQIVDSGTAVTLNAIDMIDATVGWIVGYGSTILVWNGSTWTPQISPEVDYVDVSMTSSTDGWAVGSLRIVHWNGSEWLIDDFTPPYSLHAVTHVNSEMVWAVGVNPMLRAITFDNFVYLPLIKK
ncbi:MAG: hypothetical protein GY943_15840 [Chloroflexi bacterium]|nr:hypothetical protein [Chloroflexota bacterium]